MLITRLRVPGARRLATTNPGSQNHWLSTKWIKKGGKTSTAHCTFTMDDNSSLEAEYIALQKTSFSGVFYDRFNLGKWVAVAGVVYCESNERKHVIAHDDLLKLERCISFGIDYGTTNTTAAVLLALTREHVPRLVVPGGGGQRREPPRRHTPRQRTLKAAARVDRRFRRQAEAPPASFVILEFWFLDPPAASMRAQLRADEQVTWKADNKLLAASATSLMARAARGLG
ncbi:hypothetical protein [Leucobacter japonicus]|uniref:hypothetical protein n=1 Tax=Leucobacter japonicus TaxID=1461259 RepID=UPI0006A79FD1|nr:hypothetical protein [Leucobacter japonicus]